MRRRKKVFSALIFTIISWGAWFYIFYYTSPSSGLMLTIFHLVLFLSLFLTLSLLLANSRYGFLLAGGVIGYLLLRFAKMANFLNLLLLASLLLTIEVYFRKR